MKINNIIMGAIGVMICVIMIGGALLPVVANVTADSDTFVNDGYYTMDVVTDDYTMSWSATNKEILLINDSEFDLTRLPRGAIVTLVATQDMILRCRYSDQTDNFYFSSYGEAGYWETDSTANDRGFVLSCADGVVTVNYVSSSTASRIYPVADEVYVLNPTDTGIFTMKKSNSPAYVLESSSIVVLAGNTRVGSTDVSILAKGAVDNLDFTVINGDDTNPTFSNINATYTTSKNHVDLIELEKINFLITIDGGTSLNAEYTYFLVPTEVTADRTEPMGTTLATLFNVLPLVAVAGLVMVGTYAFISRK